MTLADRVDAFKAVFPNRQASWPWLVREQGRDVLYGIFVIGADYRNKTRFYGAYPNGYIDRVMALFPDRVDDVGLRGELTTLHVFSGSVPAGGYMRCDVRQEAELPVSVYDLPLVIGGLQFELVIADPPYSASDSEKYETKMIDRRRALAALADVTVPGGHLAWLDVCWPMHSKRQWLTVGRILVQRSTNHRARVLSIFERAA